MEIVEFLHFGFNLCYSVYFAFYHIIISFIVTGQFLCGFLCHGLNGVAAASDYVLTCTDNSFACTLKALLVFVLELGKSFDSFGVKTKPYQICICLAIILIPFLREIVAICLTFTISLIFAILIRVINLSPNRRVRRVFLRNSNQWSVVKLFASFKLFKSAPKPVNSYSVAKINNSFKEPALTCLICYENPKCILLLPCKHLCLCKKCAAYMTSSAQGLKCPLCRKMANSTMLVYT